MTEEGPTEVTIRRYQASDRDAVRAIACETAGRAPAEAPFHDPEIVADLLTRYYTEHEPDALWVAADEEADTVIGYLTGCLDSLRKRRIMTRSLLPQILLRAIGRGALVRAETWIRLRALWHTTRASSAARYRPILERYPAHLHINLKPGPRGRGVGRALVERFEAQARESGVVGVHARVQADNDGGRAFFEALGYEPIDRYPWFRPDPDYHGLVRAETVFYAKRLEPLSGYSPSL